MAAADLWGSSGSDLKTLYGLQLELDRGSSLGLLLVPFSPVLGWRSGLQGWRLWAELGPEQRSRRLWSRIADFLQLSNVWGPLFGSAW